MNKRTHRTVNGHLIEYEVAPKVGSFLRRLEAAVNDSDVSEQSLIGLAYSTDNPMLDHSMFPGRGAVTKEVLSDPAYRVMTDLLFRKRVAERGIDLAKVEARYTMTPADAAAELGVHESAIRQAIATLRLASWKRDGKHYLDPHAVRALKLTANAGMKRP